MWFVRVQVLETNTSVFSTCTQLYAFCEERVGASKVTHAHRVLIRMHTGVAGPHSLAQTVENDVSVGAHDLCAWVIA